MELRQLQQFLAVVEEGSFADASVCLDLQPASISSAIRSLGRELGAELFAPGAHGLELTDAGWALVEPARAALQGADRARSAVAATSGVLRGCLRIATVAVPRYLDVMATARRFQQDHPDVDVQVVRGGSRQVLELVTGGEADFGITSVTRRASPSVRFEPLMNTSLALLCPAGHRLAGARSVDPAELVDEPIVDLPRGWWARDEFDRVFRARNLFRRVRLESDDPVGLLRMVGDGSALGYGPSAIVETELFPGVTFAGLADAPSCEVGLVTLSGVGPRRPVVAFLDAYREQCRLRGRGDHEAAAPRPTSVQLSRIA
jgi:DNA-binding transcriptional LysR family regulator